MEILRFLPKSWISYFIGKLAHIPLPKIISKPLLSWFIKKYNIDLSEVENPIDSFNSIGQFFTRTLKNGARPIQSEPVSPADSYLRSLSRILSDQKIDQIKDKSYFIKDLIGSEEDAEKFIDGQVANFYLSPKDYHRVHSPVTGQITKLVYIPGALWPVNDWSINTIKNLFCINERVVIHIKTAMSEVVLVMVGATNVGKISLSFDTLVTNQAPWKKLLEGANKMYSKQLSQENIIVKAGEHLGTFHLGSTVIVLFDRNTKNLNSTSRVIKYGQTLNL